MDRKESIPIAIIGMSCRYAAGIDSPERLWDFVANGWEGWTEVPDDRFNENAFYHPDPDAPGAINQKGGHFIKQNIADFDSNFFNISPMEAEALDPQQRIILETSWESVENAGIVMEDFRGSDTGVFFAMFGHDYEQAAFKDPLSFTQWHNLGIARPLLANRLSFVFDLRGPSVMIDTACSGSLVAVNAACQSLCSGEATMALAGGVGLIFSPDQMALMSLTQLFNSEGRSFTFDDRGNGYGRAEGVGVLLLKRLDDALRDGDNIRAVIRSSGVNSDGHTKGITLPSQEAQERLARSVFRNLPFSPAEVQYAEAHGTGTKAGDGVEMRTIRNVFCEGRNEESPLYLGATKPNIGHSEAASGAAGLIKTVMAIEKGYVPPQLLLENFKPGLSLDPARWNLKIARALTPWPETSSTRKAVVNSFGFGGTNAMVVLESHCSPPRHNGIGHITNRAVNGTNKTHQAIKDGGSVYETTHRLFTLSAKSEHSLRCAVDGLKTYVDNQNDIDLDNLSYTLTSRRSNFQWRFSVVSRDSEALALGLGDKNLALTKAWNDVANVFVFTGQGAQWSRMGYDLLRLGDNVFTSSIHRSENLLKSFGAEWNLVDELAKEESCSQINDSRFGQPASTAVQLALVDLLKSWNLLPSAVIGHSSGEIAAAYTVGAISQASAIRIAYERSFLAEKAKHRSSQPGSMMAVGVGQDSIANYIERLDPSHGQAMIACLNSPSSTTVSGDANAISELHKALDADGIFARRLKVDAAYHSHHMRAVSNDYLSALENLESTAADPTIRYFSTVTGQEKFKGFGASYWVDNLVSQVRFSDGLQHLCQAMDETTTYINLIEIGPHKALSGPIRQILTSLEKPPSWTYIPTLVRGENSIGSLLGTASGLYTAGSPVNISKAAALSIISPSPHLLHDLPPYRWDHTTTHWTETRLSREHRHRRHAQHDLLGLRIITSPSNQPSWRILLRIDRMPWLRDHVVDNFIVFPAAGYMTMAIQGLDQLTKENEGPDKAVKGYRLQNVSFKKTLRVPKEVRDGGVETIIAFKWNETLDNWGFTVFSISEQGKWQEHCDGNISVVLDADSEEIGQAREAELDCKSRAEYLQKAQEACTIVIAREAMYADMASTGNQFGPCFSINLEARLSDYQSVNLLEIPDVSAVMPSQFQQPHVIHPATLDGVIQTCLPLFKQHSVPGSVMPLFISDTYISAAITKTPGQRFSAVCDLQNVFPYSTNFSTSVFQTDASGQQACVLTMTRGEIRVVGEAQSLSRHTASDNVFKLQWGLDASSVTASTLEAVTIPLQSDEAGITQAEKVDLTSVACARYIEWAVREVLDKGLLVKDDHRANWWQVLLKYHASEECTEFVSRSPKTIEELNKLTSRLGIEGEAVARIGPELVALITGQTDPLSHFLKDDLLFRVYHSDEAARPNRYMADYARMLTFQHPKMRILELGAGTGGTTYQILKQCSPDGQDFCAEYMYTDISSGFFEAVRTSRLKDWAHLLTFQTLDLEKDPAEQGFEEGVYDLVVAANVVHATRSLSRSLKTIYRLLKPGGILGLVELTRTTPYINMTFGSIPGWWAGVDEGRTESPLQSPEQWDEKLKIGGFSGVDLAAYDLPEPERHSVLLLSTRLPDGAASKRAGTEVNNSVQVLSALPDDHTGNAVVASLETKSSSLGSKCFVGSWSEETVDKSASYLLVDSADHLLVQKATPRQFSRITSLLTKARKVFWVTLADTNNTLTPNNAMTTGLSRTARNENPELNCFTIDVQALLASETENISQIISQFIITTEAKLAAQQPVEFELMYRNGQMHIQRFVLDTKLLDAVSTNQEYRTSETLFHQPECAVKLHVAKPGLLNSLVFVDDFAYGTDLGPDEVEIQAHAFGLNFSDVFIALGQLPPSQPMVGECAGVITRIGSNFISKFNVGDRVAAMFATPYASRARANGHLVNKIPQSIAFQEAASIPLAYGTAWYALVECAHLESGQTVLIHAASGGLGQVAIRIAQSIGATVFATVSTVEKKEMLVSRYNIPESHIFSSRTTDFSKGVKRLTEGQGVDVVLNSLSGVMLQASWEAVAPFGTFVEVGKTDIYRRSQLTMEPFRNNLKFASVDLVLLAQKRPIYVAKMLQRIWADVESGVLSALPITSFPIGDIEKAFRLMQARGHMGKIVLEAGEKNLVVARTAELKLKEDATYVIVGGLGGLGKLLCRHLQMRGARHVALFTRQSLHPSDRFKLETELTTETGNATVRIVTCDVTDTEVVARVANEMQKSMPPVKGILHGGMVLADNLISKISQADLSTALAPKVQGTDNLYTAFPLATLDFFVLMSSLCAIIGTLGQSNYAAAGTYQDMFAHARVSEGHNNVIAIDFPLIQDTYPVTQDRILSLGRQGCQYLDVATVWPVLDYAMSGAAERDRNNQLAWGLDPQSFITQAEQGMRVPPLLGNIVAHRRNDATKRIGERDHKRSAEDDIARAKTVEEAESLVLETIQSKIASLTALDLSDLDLDTPVANMALDSLVATEIKNWITNTLQAQVQTSDIMDAQSLRSLASLVTSVSGLVKRKAEDDEKKVGDKRTNGEVKTTGNSSKGIGGELPKYPLPPLQTTMDIFLDSVAHLGSEDELEQAKKAIAQFVSPEGVGLRMQSRLEKLAVEDTRMDEVVDMYVRNKWLRGRDWRPRLRNFFATLPFPKEPQTQGDRAARIVLAAYAYKQSLDEGTVQGEFLGDDALSMDTIYWLFNSNRTPVLNCDRPDRYPNNDFIVVMRRGHAWKVDLNSSGQEHLGYRQLQHVFQAIQQEQLENINWAGLLSTADRDEWARTREEIMLASEANTDFVETIEKCLFIICLDDASPTTAAERANCFLLDDNSNRWLDKTLSFVVCANGVSAIFGEHTMVDGTTFGGLIKAITSAPAIDEVQEVKHLSSRLSSGNSVKYMSFTMPPTLETHVPRLLSEHMNAHKGYNLCNYELNYGASYLRNHKLPPKSVMQLLIQLAVRRQLGYNPLGAVDVISQRPFRGGRTDMIYVMTPPVQSFCAIAEESSVPMSGRRKKFLEAIKSHARLMTLSTRGRGFRWPLMALKEMKEEDEPLPEFYHDRLYQKTNERPVCTSFTEFGLPEMGRCQPKRDDIWVGCQVFDEMVRFTVIDGVDGTSRFVRHLKDAGAVMKQIIEADTEGVEGNLKDVAEKESRGGLAF